MLYNYSYIFNLTMFTYELNNHWLRIVENDFLRFFVIAFCESNSSYHKNTLIVLPVLTQGF